MGRDTLADKTTDTLVQDIYDVLATKEVPDGVDLEAEIDNFGEGVKRLMRQQFTEYHAQGDSKRTLRMSNIGRDDRYLWNVMRGTKKEELQPHTYLKFMYGHLIEELLLFLTKASGHEVTDEQKQCEVQGIKGHMDCKIDGVVTDIKSASTYSFKKFKDGSLAENDPFGYVAQIKGYAFAEGQTTFGWLAMDKQNGHLTYLKYDAGDSDGKYYDKIGYDIEERIKHIKKMVALDTPPEVCSEPVPDGQSGNLKLSITCSYCPYKETCYPSLRTFLYSTGPRHLVHVEREPNVRELGGKNAGDF